MKGQKIKLWNIFNALLTKIMIQHSIISASSILKDKKST